ncbi:MAG: DNA polymerase III subunit gamma/tau [Lysobacter sp.]
MSYLVLARKWRPKRFAELVGQEHVVRALTNALDTGRVHHAFLFSGTRGVGKTTIARIFAKSLNCEQGTSADPCGECNSCKDIDAGRFIDLLEIDAASNTGVDDVRDLIDNAQYMPSRGRVKVYLIDEVHMLSKSAFNALLKTLEEPPGHVKFLLATTDPQKLPVTVLSRCLQFNLKRLDEAQIGGQVEKILQAEGIAVEPGAVRQISKAADGSLRDGLSLLDQAIAYTAGQLTDAAVATMLGTVDQTRVGALLDALGNGDGETLLAEVATLAEFSPDWGSVLEALTEALHRIQVRQLVPSMAVDADGVDVDSLAAKVPVELVQLWYQMAINGRRDLPLAPSPRAGFEMSVLRMLAFRPAGPGAGRPAAAASERDDAAVAGPATPTPAAIRSHAEPRAPQIAYEARAPELSAVDVSQPLASSRVRDPGIPVLPAVSNTGPTAESPATLSAMPLSVAMQPVDEPAISPAITTSEVPGLASVADVAVPAAGNPIANQDGDAEAHEHGEHREAGPWLSLEDEAAAMPAATVARSMTPTAASAGTSAASQPERKSDAEFEAAVIDDADSWHAWVVGSTLRGPARVLAEHVGFISCEGAMLRLGLSADDELLNKPALVAQIAEALAPLFGDVPEIRFEAATGTGISLRERNERARDERQAAAEHIFMNDTQVQQLVGLHGAKIVADSIRPFDGA